MELELVAAPITKFNELDVLAALKGIDIKCIQFFESVDTRTYVVLDNGSRKQVFAPLYVFEEMLPKDVFFRCGWSHVVNVSRINSFFMLNDTTLVMDCGEEILIPRYQRHTIFKIMEQMWFAQQRQIG